MLRTGDRLDPWTACELSLTSCSKFFVCQCLSEFLVTLATLLKSAQNVNKNSLKKRKTNQITMVEKTALAPGDTVYARWFGDDTLTIIREADVRSPFPHYICRSDIDGDRYLISKLWLSTSRILPEVSDSNRKQLDLGIFYDKA